MLSPAELLGQAPLGDSVHRGLNNPGMSSELWQRIRAIRKRAEMSGESFGAELSVTKAAVSQWESAEPAKRTTPDLQKLMNMARLHKVPLDWLLDDASPSEFPGWLATKGHPASEGSAPLEYPHSGALAHSVLLDEFTVPSLTTWGELMQTKELPTLFRVAVPDDALAPKIPRGAELIMAAGGTPRPSQVVLVREGASGALHLRRYAQGAGENWQARAPNVDYPTFDAAEHSLQLLATLKWVSGEDA